MSSTLVEWQADDLVSLGQELQAKIATVRGQFEERAQQASGDDELTKLKSRLESLLDTIQQGFREKAEALQKDGGGGGLYNNELAGIDLDLLVYEGDRQALGNLLGDMDFASIVHKLLGELKPHNARKELLTKGLKLTKGMAPLVHRITDHCSQALQLKAKIEVYVYQDAAFNAACYPPVKNKVLLMLTSSLLEKFTQRELAFVVGHELGHYLFEHTRFPVDYILTNGEGYLSPLHAMKLFAWIRNAEVTADRTGLVCCRDFNAAASAFFKLSSGITGTALEFKIDEYLAQLQDLRKEIENEEENDPQDWFSTHPFNPLRIKALEIFSKSATYAELCGQPPRGTARTEMEGEIAALMSIMEPTYLKEEGDLGKKCKEYLINAGYLVAAANGIVEHSEVKALMEILGPGETIVGMKELQGEPLANIKARVEELSKTLCHISNGAQRLQMIRDMVVISYADGSVDEFELNCLYWLCDNLRIDPSFVDHVLGSAQTGVD